MIVIGVGNPTRGDDAAGWAVVDRLETVPERTFELVRSSGDAAAIISAWEGFAGVILVDAIRSAGPPGGVRTIDLLTTPVPELTTTSTHGFGTAAAIELARALKALPSRLVLVGVVASSFEHGAPLSEAVTVGVDHAVMTVLQIVGNSSTDHPDDGTSQ